MTFAYGSSFLAKKRAATLALLLSASFIPSLSAHANGCGEPPVDAPALPSLKALTVDNMLQSRADVLSYSSDVDKYLSCMDARYSTLATYMTDDQRERWNNDLVDIHENRKSLQLALNERIRALRSNLRGSE